MLQKIIRIYVNCKISTLILYPVVLQLLLTAMWRSENSTYIEILGSGGSKAVGCFLLDLNAMQSCSGYQRFRGTSFKHSGRNGKEFTTSSYKTLIETYKSTQRHNLARPQSKLVFNIWHWPDLLSVVRLHVLSILSTVLCLGYTSNKV